MEQQVRRLTRAAGRPTVPPPPDPTLGIWMVSMGFRLRPMTLRLRLSVRTPHRAILPWARYLRIDPLGLDQNARWTDLLLATGLTGQLRKGQPVTGNTGHWSHRVHRSDRVHQSYRSNRVHRSHRSESSSSSGYSVPGPV